MMDHIVCISQLDVQAVSNELYDIQSGFFRFIRPPIIFTKYIKDWLNSACENCGHYFVNCCMAKNGFYHFYSVENYDGGFIAA